MCSLFKEKETLPPPPAPKKNGLHLKLSFNQTKFKKKWLPT